MVTDTTPVHEIYLNSQGRKRASFTHEILHYINTGETALARFLRGYLDAALGSSSDENDIPLDGNYSIADIDKSSLVSAWAECSRFFRDNDTDLTHLDDERNGRNFWITRNAHGYSNGFWFEPVFSESAEIAMQQLSYASESFGKVSLHVGADRKLHFSNERSIL